MKDANQEIIRRVLSNVLSRLEGSDSPPAQKIAEPAAIGSSPMIFIVLNDPASGREDDRNRSETSERATNRLEVNHPGLERFSSVEERPGGLAPKKCFMEPDRVCVNSGACEMRGF